jgi:hypothetical protein
MEHGCGSGGIAATGPAEDTAGIVRDNFEADWLRGTDAAGIPVTLVR